MKSFGKKLALGAVMLGLATSLSAQSWVNGGANSNILFPSSMNTKVAIGLGNPQAPLHVQGDGDYSAFLENGKVSIGAGVPIDLLHLADHHNDRTWIRIENSDPGNQASVGLSVGGFNNNIPGWNGAVHAYFSAGYDVNNYIGTNWQNKAVSYTGSGTAGYEFHLSTENQTFAWTRKQGSGRQVDLAINSTGRVGVGTESPSAKLHVNGSLALTDGSQADGYVLVSDANGQADWRDPATVFSGNNNAPSCTTPVTFPVSGLNMCNTEVLETGSNGGDRLYIGSPGGSQPLTWGAYPTSDQGFRARTENYKSAQITYNPWTNKIVFDFTENVSSGVGSPVEFKKRILEISSGELTNNKPRIVMGGSSNNTTNHDDALLHVNGEAIARAVLVTDLNWSDFVFEDDYALRSLAEVEAFIEENGHLPDIPSAEEVEENGVSLGDMDARLLQKVEELTLYLIELEKDKAALVARLEQLENAAR
ncbi:MAG: hypothetical protein AAGN35_07695 [Bacteroidota bacterium]